MKIKIQTCLWFESDAESAADFYASLIKDSKVKDKVMQGDKALTVTVSIAGHDVTLLNGGPHFKLSEAASIMAICDDEAEADRLYKAFINNGGTASQCGWLKDRWGVSWQIVPAEFLKMASDKDQAKVSRMMQAMMPMQQLDMSLLRQAFEGK